MEKWNAWFHLARDKHQAHLRGGSGRVGADLLGGNSARRRDQRTKGVLAERERISWKVNRGRQKKERVSLPQGWKHSRGGFICQKAPLQKHRGF